MGQLPAFFQAYANGNQATLGRFLAPGVSLTGLNGAVDFHSLSAVSVPPGGATRHIIATVMDSSGRAGQAKGGEAPAQLEMAYALTVLKQNGTWYVEDINAATSLRGRHDRTPMAARPLQARCNPRIPGVNRCPPFTRS